jgi:hypothetical protein
MNNINDIISSIPSGKITLKNNVTRQNNIVTNIKTSNESTEDINKKINNNEFLCNQQNDDSTDDQSSNVEGFVNYNKKSYIIYTFFLLFIIIGLVFIINKLKSKK